MGTQKKGKARAAAKAGASNGIVIARGPRKQRKPGAPAPRLSLHKPRTGWFRARAAWPLREAPVAKLLAERRRVLRALPPAKAASKWEIAGPTNIGGRCTSLVCDPADADRILIGSAGGGVWASRDAGKTWKPSWRERTPLEIGALALDLADPKTVYCGTGEADLSADSYAGDGIYRSTNGGETWKPWASCAKAGVPRRIGAIAVDPFDRQHVLVGGVGYGRVSSENEFGGLYVTSNGGTSWTRETFISTNNYWCHCIVSHPVVKGTLFATFTGPGAKSGIYRSTDGGATWTQLTKGLPAPERMGRTTVVQAPSDPRIIYALVADASSGSADRLLGVFKSNDSGNTWSKVSGTYFEKEGQMSYGNSIAVHPTNPDIVICGGVDLHRTTDGGATWALASKWDAERGTARYAHADHHALRMPTAAPGRIYSANDGGMDVSEDSGEHWQNRSGGLAVTMFYDIDVAQTDARLYGGGAQDNGTLITKDGVACDFSELLGGDGGWMVVDPKEAGHIYASWQYGGMYRFRNGSARKVSPPFKPEDMGGVWMVYITFDPNDQNVVFTGNQRIYRTRNDGLSWEALTPSLDESPISAIEVAPANSKAVYVATENGGFFRSLDGGATWSANLASPELPQVTITRIETDPADAKTVYATVSNFGHSHVFRSTDAGATWADIDGGKLPDAPHHALLIRPDAPKELYVGNDAGVFMTNDGGLTWQNVTANLPNVMVVDLVYHTPSKTLLAATYGRSIWKRILA